MVLASRPINEGGWPRSSCGPVAGAAGGWTLFEQIDRWRRWQGEMLDGLGFGPIETPSRVVWDGPGVTLVGYAEEEGARPVALLVPAPIKRAYIWDLVPWASVVRRCLGAAVAVYLIRWERPGPAEEGFGLAEYADRLILGCLDAIEAETGRSQAFLIGHSLGGTLAAVFSALHPERVQGLALIGAPLHFGRDVEAIGRLVAGVPPACRSSAVPGNVPGSFLDMASVLAAPTTFEAARWVDWLLSLPDPQAVDTHLRVERWALDEAAMASQLFQEVVEQLYREDQFMCGGLTVRGRRAVPASVAAPLLAVVDAHCAIAPPRSVLPFLRAVRGTGTRLIRYEGDVGVALRHVGMLVGRSAHRHLWPEILRWIRASGEPAGSGGRRRSASSPPPTGASPGHSSTC